MTENLINKINLINSMLQSLRAVHMSLSWFNCSRNSLLLWNPLVHHHFTKGSHWTSPQTAESSSFLNIYFHIIPPPQPVSPKWSLPLKLPYKNAVTTYYFYQVCYMSNSFILFYFINLNIQSVQFKMQLNNTHIWQYKNKISSRSLPV
jgi:hypothetical protein